MAEAPRGISLAFVMAAILGGIVLVTVAATMGLTVSASFTNTVSLLNQRSIDLVDHLRSALDQHLQPADAFAVETVAAIEDGRLNPNDYQAITLWFSGALATTPQIRALAIFSPGAKGWAVHRAQGNLAAEPDAPETNSAILPAFRDALRRKAGIPYWGEVIHVYQTSMINLRVKIAWPGGGFGMLAVVISLDDLSRYTADLTPGDRMTGFILYGKDHVLAHPSFVEGTPELGPDRPLLPLAELADPVLRRIWTGQAPPPFAEAAARGAVVRVDATDEPENTFIFGETLQYGETPWYIGVHAKTDTVGRELSRFVGSSLIALALGVVAVVAAVLIGRRLARPLRRSAAVATKIGHLDLDTIAALPNTGVRELDQQADAFNRMVEALRAFATYVPRQLVAQLAERGFSGEVPSTSGPVTVLFTDIVGFTGHAEALPAHETAALLNHHFSLLGAAVEEEGGIIDKYVGDSLMAFWAKPLAADDAPARAVAAATRIAAALHADNQARQVRGEAVIRVRIGIHTGDALAGSIGAAGRVDYTVVGDTVNIAQRLQEFGRHISPDAECTVLLSEAVEHHLSVRPARDPVGAVPIRGREETVNAWQLTLRANALPREPAAATP